MGSRWFLFIYFSPEGSVTSPPTQTSQALLAARGTEQESARLVKKKKKKREATDGGVERMRGDTVCGQHLFIIDCCVELWGRDVHMTAWGNVLDAQCRVRADTHTSVILFFVVRSQINVAPIDWSLIGKFGPCLIFFVFFLQHFQGGESRSISSCRLDFTLCQDGSRVSDFLLFSLGENLNCPTQMLLEIERFPQWALLPWPICLSPGLISQGNIQALIIPTGLCSAAVCKRCYFETPLVLFADPLELLTFIHSF